LAKSSACQAALVTYACKPTPLTGKFLLKDIPLLGLSFWTLADSLRAVERQVATTDAA
jgi:hypothetical protein